MGKNQAYKAMQRARLGSSSAGSDEVEDGMVCTLPYYFKFRSIDFLNYSYLSLHQFVYYLIFLASQHLTAVCEIRNYAWRFGSYSRNNA